MHEKSHGSLEAFDNWKCRSFRWELGEDRLPGTQVQPRTWGLEAEPPPPRVPQLAPAPHTTPSKGKVFWSCNSKSSCPTQGWKCLLSSQWSHGQQEYPGLKGWPKDVQTFQPPKHPVYSSYAFTLLEGKTGAHLLSLSQEDQYMPVNLCKSSPQPKVPIPTKHPLLLEDPTGLHLSSSELCNDSLLALSI